MTNVEFEQAMAKLNPAQREAVEAIEGPVMVIAGPGTGKTQILTLRIANILLQTDTPPSGILALTFTEAGQKAMKRRLRHFVGGRADEVGIFTYHGFAASVLAEFGEHFPHLARARQLSEVEAETLVREILREKRFAKLRPLGEPEFYVHKIIHAIADCRKEAWTPELTANHARQEIERLKNDPASLATRGATKGQLKAAVKNEIIKAERTIIFSEVYERYETAKREQKGYDFDDLIFEVLQALESDELLLQLLQEKYLYLLVDEHQDTNNAQNLLIKKIADFYDEPNLFVVGDEKQAIYRFQGASVRNFLAFQTRWPTMKIISLTENYRSPQDLLDATFAMIEHNYDQGEHELLRQPLRSPDLKKDQSASVLVPGVTVVSAPNDVTAEEYLINQIKDIVEREPERTVAVIGRTNREVSRALACLVAAGVPVVAERGTDIFAQPFGVLYFKLLEFLADESQLEALAYTLAGGLWGLDLARSSGLIKRLRSGRLPDFEKELPDLAVLKKRIARSGSLEFLIMAVELSGLAKVVAADPASAQGWRAIIDLAKDLARSKGLEDPRLLIAELLAYRQMAETRVIKLASGATDAPVVVMTAHGAKGLEYDYVFLPYAVDESWFPKGRGRSFVWPEAGDDGDETRDARRLFYVALTRAKRSATIISYLVDVSGRNYSPLRFVSELAPERVTQIALPKFSGSLPAPVGNLIEKDLTESREYAKRLLLEQGLSVTALNHFSDCPSKFFYKSILKLPEPPNPASEKGNAMHEALAAIWSLPKKSESAMIGLMSETIKNYFQHSLLPAYEREAALDELLVAVSPVAVALADHFAQAGRVVAEKWQETVFAGEFGGWPVALPLHGKLDAVIDQPKQILVYDYKTKLAMSESAIRGETKNDDGNYFRQLVFYRILLTEMAQGRTVLPALVFVKPDEKGRCPTVALPVTAGDVSRVEKEIQTLIDSVWSGRFLTDRCADPACEFCRLRELTGDN